ncbi:hypothetical protein KTO58_04685 [Chitinophaga pendula]|uniref:MauE/DoxX family redox-associated membrane protein n=1 Tax=Chitinophaga TaxID=79328 RepID=UPI000BAEEC0F|nr:MULTISPECIES: MauE/DoxX family redox-associated membrane protein [Chitinophaga]ASZ13891.1 hypothetical protein CK934_24500 [Chitinophaga sp. MD30]UCJ08489.1 hypothetical protein KTO58_04685 [Chitinophaga pendula]
MKNRLVVLATYLIAFLFIMVGVSKLMDYPNYAESMGKAPIVARFSSWFTPLLPLVEIVVAGLLMTPKLRHWGFIISLVMMIVFTGYNIYLVIFATSLPCTCGGIFTGMSWRNHLIVNLIFTGLALMGTIDSKYKFTPTFKST